MHPANHQQEQDDLPDPGKRWGVGAGSVLPYLTRSLLAKPPAERVEANEAAGRASNPVFAEWRKGPSA